MSEENDKLRDLPPIFFPSDGNVDQKMFAPVAKLSTSLDCMVGYFASSFLSELSIAISNFLNTSKDHKMKFLISPNFQLEDLLAIENAYGNKENFFEMLFPEAEIEPDRLKRFPVKALAYLIVHDRIELKVAIKRNGLFHTKCWLFTTKNGLVAIHGSSNATSGGMVRNFEQLILSRAWVSEESSMVCSSLAKKFDEIWNGEIEDLRIIPLNEETISKLRKYVDNYQLTDKEIVENLNLSYKPDVDENFKVLDTKISELSIPSYIIYEKGAFQHQGDAVKSWISNGYKGIMSIATGGGKTYTSLIGAAKLVEEKGNTMILIAVPTKALMNQWVNDVREFGVEANNTIGKSPKYIKQEILKSLRMLRLNTSKVEICIITHNALVSGLFDELEKHLIPSNVLLIADEVHNLGSLTAQKRLPKYFDYKIGLSATHDRQFDEQGSSFLVGYFAGVVYEYGLDKAIGSCLVNYNYYVHVVYLTADEEDEFQELTNKIRKLSYAASESKDSPAKEQWKKLCLKRRVLIEAAEKKVDALRELLPKSSDEINKTLVFCTDKKPGQLENVNNVFNSLKVKFHQVTAEETSNKNKLRNIIESFSKDELQVLTSKRVLDEGFNVPQTENAYLLASNTVKRQWIQRLGRVLRLSNSTGKKHANIYDFMVLPQVTSKVDDDLKALIESEYKRITFFSEHSANLMDKNGGYFATKKLLTLLGVG